MYSRPLTPLWPPVFIVAQVKGGNPTIRGLLELVPDTLQLLHGLHVGGGDPLQHALLLVQLLLQRVHLLLDLLLGLSIL